MSKTANSCRTGWKRIKEASQYKYVLKYIDPNGDVHWAFKFSNTTAVEVESEREAALRVDKALIGRGKEPVNILKRK
jgi:hypothetical protein